MKRRHRHGASRHRRSAVARRVLFPPRNARAPIDLLRRHGVPMALATDWNPGTSPLCSPLLVLNMAATLFRMTVDECLTGVTRAAAQALGMADRMRARGGQTM